MLSSNVSQGVQHGQVMLDFAQFAEKVLWGLLSGSALYIASSVRNMQQSLQELNVKMAEFTERISNQKDRLDNHEHRIERLENIP